MIQMHLICTNAQTVIHGNSLVAMIGIGTLNKRR